VSKQLATDFHSVRIAVEQQVVVQLAEQAIDTGPGFTPMRQPSIALKTRRGHVPLE
jgi:hypothetical protein